jgi:monoamine oxidase
MHPPDTRETDVAVVGGGFSGLAAGRALVAGGADVLVLEARERVGGRVDRALVDGVALDLGGTWAGPTQQRITALADELGVATIPQHSELENIVDLDGRIRRYKGVIPRVGLATLLDMGRMQLSVGRAARRVDPAAAWEARGAAGLDAQSVDHWLRRRRFSRRARTLLAIAGRTIWGAEPRELSLLFALAYIGGAGGVDALLDTDGGAQHERFEGGALLIAERLAEQLAPRVVLGAAVRRIALDDHGVTVSGPRLTVRAQRVIVALPPPLCARIAIEPQPTPARLTAQNDWRMGALTKCFAVYDEPFWRADGASGEAVGDGGLASLTFDVSPPDGSCGVLLGFVGGDDARRHAALGEQAGRAAVLDGFARLFGERALRPEAWEQRAWADEPFSSGGPVAIAPPGSFAAADRGLREPQGRLIWAGSECATQWRGYIEGAVVAGEHAAGHALAAL